MHAQCFYFVSRSVLPTRDFLSGCFPLLHEIRQHSDWNGKAHLNSANEIVTVEFEKPDDDVTRHLGIVFDVERVGGVLLSVEGGGDIEGYKTVFRSGEP